ncbi:hypothetical protein [Arthrobacter agilis]|uniref:hypothetical protein n=1 Tax=Arthrobacter agilis TaxID=37921 RepID=UPI001ABF36B3|nr:hypothetical protein [Arthrobacter agilis]
MKHKFSKSPRLFQVFPSEDPHNLIVRYPFEDDAAIEYGFAEAAKRLAASFSGQPRDDTILMPFLFLWRHAIELTLKDQIRTAAYFRRANGEQETTLEKDNVAARLKKTHSLGKLAHELTEHFHHLELPTMPSETVKALQWLSDADPTGVAFRYSGNFPETQDYIDFPKLSKSLEETYNMISAGADVLSAFGDALSEYLEIQRELQADYEAEMRQYMDDYY